MQPHRSAGIRGTGPALYLLLGIGLLMLTDGPSAAGPPKPATPPAVRALEPAEVLRGMPVKGTGTDFDQATEIRVRLHEKELEQKLRSEDGKSCTFPLPQS